MGIKMEKFTEMINALDSWLWGLPMIVLLLSGVIAKETRHYLANLDEKRSRLYAAELIKTPVSDEKTCVTGGNMLY